MIKKLMIFVVLGLLPVIFYGCFDNMKQDSEGNALPSSKDYPVVVLGQKFKEAPEKVVVTSPSIVDIIHTLKYTQCIVAKSDECLQSYLSEVPTIGTQYDFDVNKIELLNADLLISDKELTVEQKESLERIGVKFLVLPKATDREHFNKLYTNLGSLFGGANEGYTKAMQRAQNIFNTIENINKLVPEEEKQITVCYMYDTKGTVVTGDTLANEIIKLSGAINIAESRNNYHMDVEELIVKNPACIFCNSGLSEEIKNKAEFAEMYAIQKSYIYEMDDAMLEYQGDTIVDAVAFMMDILHPDVLANINDEYEEEAQSESATEKMNSEEISPEVSNTIAAGTILKLYDTGDEVYKMQTRLKELGHTYKEADGVFDELTEQGVMNFQFLSNLDATGIADEETLNKLYASDAVTGPDYET